MPSEFLDPAETERRQRLEFAFPARSLEGRVILVPGGSGGLGAATVALLASEGAQVVVGYRRRRERAEGLAATLNKRSSSQVGRGGRVHCVQADLTQPEGRKRLLEAAAGLTGQIYGLVSFAGDPARVALEDLDEAALTGSLTTNYIAPLLLARDVGLHMQKNKVAGSLVFLSTMQAVAPFEGSVNYAVPKAALQHAALILAKQWGPEIRVNVVAPGVNAAGMALESIESGKYDRFVRDGIIPRFGRPEDVARVVRLLLIFHCICYSS